MAPSGSPGAGALTPLCRLKGHEERVWSVAWRPGANPPLLASCGSDRGIRFWGPPRASALQEPWVLIGEADATDRHTRTLRSVAWDPTGDILVVASFDATTSLWSQPRRRDEASAVGGGIVFECKGLVSGHENEVKCAGFSPSGEYLATCSRDKSVWIFETDASFEYECVSVLQSHTQDVKTLRWHPSQDVLFSCSYDDAVKIWGPDGDDWSCKETLAVHESTVWSIAFDSVGARFATSSDDRTVRIWAPGPAPGAAMNGKHHEDVPVVAEGERLPIAAAAWVSPLFRFATLRSDASAASSAPAEPAPAPAPVEAPAAEPEAEVSLEAPADASCAWHVVSTITGEHTRPVYSVDWMWPENAASAEGGRDTLATACGDNHVRVFRNSRRGAGDWVCAADVEAHAGDANCVAWCPKALPGGAALLASAGDDFEVAIWRFDG